MVKIERTKNASRNIIFGMLLKIYQMVVPFLMRTAMIYLMGVQYLGLSSLFTSVLQVLNLAELGVGSAMVFSMYKPIAENDEEKVCALLKLYRVYYFVIGTAIAVIGLLLVPFIPKLIKGDVPPNINLYVLYILNLGATVLSYWVYAYRNSILQAHQRTDVISKVSLGTNTAQYILQLLVLYVFHNYYYFVIAALLCQTLTNVICAYCAGKMYPQYIPKGEVDISEREKINGKIRDLFTAKLGNVIVTSVDTIVISAFLGLTELAIYQNYYFIMNSIYGIVLILFSSVIAGIGNSLITESDEKNYKDLKIFTFLISWIITVCVCCFAVLYQPFMKLWVGETLMLDYSFVIMFCFYFFVLVLAMIWATAKDAAGMWRQDRFRPLIGAIGNLVLNVFLVQVIGLYGIILSTILSYLLISMPWLVHNIFKYIYKRSAKQYILRVLWYTFICIVSCAITIIVCNTIEVEGLIALVVYGLLAVAISCGVQLLAYFRTDEFKDSKLIVLKILHVRGKK